MYMYTYTVHVKKIVKIMIHSVKHKHTVLHNNGTCTITCKYILMGIN